MDGFVDSVGEKDLRGIELEKVGNFFFDGLALRIAGKQLGIEGTQAREDAGRTSDGALVEIETKAGASR
jgi:hypothetical protein